MRPSNPPSWSEGLILYAAVRIGVDAFYSELGATPDEVGLSYASTLTRAAVGLVGYAVFGAMLFWLLLVANEFLDDNSSKTKRRIGGLITACMIFCGSAFVGAGFYAAVRDLFSEVNQSDNVPAWILLAGPAVVAVTALLVWPHASRGWRIIISLLILISIAMIGTRVQSRGRELAEDVRTGEAITPDALFSVLPLAATCVTFEWVATESTLGGRFLYLGGADGTVLLLKAEQAESRAVLYRIPQSSIRIRHGVADDRPCVDPPP